MRAPATRPRRARAGTGRRTDLRNQGAGYKEPGEGGDDISDDTNRGTSRALLLLAAGYAAWAVIVIYITGPVAPAQRAIMAGSLLAVGALACGMGYLSSLRRGALRRRQESLGKLLEERRRARGR